jgi:uncharacterized SAM-binding protein YcdF (DUF218 family)
MAFFLSKFLPLFIYPLGLSSILAMVGLLLSWRKQSLRLGRYLILTALVILYISSNRYFSDGLVRSLEYRYIPAAELPTADAIVVLGGGIKPQTPPRPWIEVGDAGDRLIYGARLYQQKKAPWLILSGGRVTWRVDGGKGSESEDMAILAEALGVPRSAMLQDSTSFNTKQNAENVLQILKAQNLKTVLLVTSALHIPRALAIFQRLGIEATPAPTDFLLVDSDSENSLAEFSLKNLPDTGALTNTTNAIKEYLGMLLAGF